MMGNKLCEIYRLNFRFIEGIGGNYVRKISEIPIREEKIIKLKEKILAEIDRFLCETEEI